MHTGTFLLLCLACGLTLTFPLIDHLFLTNVNCSGARKRQCHANARAPWAVGRFGFIQGLSGHSFTGTLQTGIFVAQQSGHWPGILKIQGPCPASFVSMGLGNLVPTSRLLGPSGPFQLLADTKTRLSWSAHGSVSC